MSVELGKPTLTTDVIERYHSEEMTWDELQAIVFKVYPDYLTANEVLASVARFNITNVEA